MPVAINILLAALASLSRKLFVTALVEKILAAIMFIGLRYFAKRSDNLIDDQLVNDAYFAYYGKPYPEPLNKPVDTHDAPNATTVLPSGNVYRVKQPEPTNESVEEPLLPKQLTDQ